MTSESFKENDTHFCKMIQNVCISLVFTYYLIGSYNHHLCLLLCKYLLPPISYIVLFITRFESTSAYLKVVTICLDECT